MKNLLSASAVAMTVFAASAAAPKYAANFNAGTSGIGVGIDYKFSNKLSFGGSVDYFGFAFNKKKKLIKGTIVEIEAKNGTATTSTSDTNGTSTPTNQSTTAIGTDTTSNSGTNGTNTSTNSAPATNKTTTGTASYNFKGNEDGKDAMVNTIKSSDIKIGINAKYHPFSNGFFVTAGLNLHKASLKSNIQYKAENDEKTKAINKANAKELEELNKNTTLKVTRITPSLGLGYRATIADNVILGVEAGVEYIGTVKKDEDGNIDLKKSSKLALLAKSGALPLSKSLVGAGLLPSVKVGVSYAF